MVKDIEPIYIIGFCLIYITFCVLLVVYRRTKYNRVLDKRENRKLAQQWEQLKTGFHDSCSEKY